MFRSIILSAILGTGVTTGLTMTPSAADAHPPMNGQFHRFEVVYRHHDCWEVYGTYRDRDDAERAAHHLRHEGRMVEIRRF